MNKKILIAGDHAGLDLKQIIVSHLQSQKYSIQDFGPFDTTSVDFPDFANLVCEAQLKDPENTLGILVCGSGQGMSMRANKFKNIRAALVYSNEIAKLAKEHNNANIICLGSRFCTAEEAKQWITTFINTEFSGGRHSLRVAKIG